MSAENVKKSVFVYEYVSAGGFIASAEEAAELLPLGLAMRDAIAADVAALDDWRVTVADSSMPAEGESAVDFVVRQAALHEACWVVAPETGGLLAQLAQAVGPARWIGCSAEAIALCSSKPATLHALNARGLPTPLAFAAGARRWVSKPIDGAGCVDTRLHEGLAPPAMAAGFTVEPWVDGEAMSVSLLCGRDGTAEVLAINRQRIGLHADGRLSFDGLDLNVLAPDSERGRAVAALARSVAATIPGLAGFVGIDLVWHAQHGPVLIEVNPRVTVAYAGLSAALGRKLAGEVLQRCGR